MAEANENRQSKDLREIVHVGDQGVMTTSRVIAEKFDRRHDNVLRDIRELECSSQFRSLNFEEFKINDLTGESTSHVEMTRDGFMFLVMGYTGPKAAKIKEQFIAAFNLMEQQIRQPEPRPALDAAKMDVLLKHKGRLQNRMAFRQRQIRGYVEDLAGLQGELAAVERHLLLENLNLSPDQIVPPSRAQMEKMAEQAIAGQFAALSEPVWPDESAAVLHVRDFLSAYVEYDREDWPAAAPSAFYSRYLLWVGDHNVTPLPSPPFFRALNAIWDEEGLIRRSHMDGLRFLGACLLSKPRYQFEPDASNAPAIPAVVQRER